MTFSLFSPSASKDKPEPSVSQKNPIGFQESTSTSNVMSISNSLSQIVHSKGGFESPSATYQGYNSFSSQPSPFSRPLKHEVITSRIQSTLEDTSLISSGVFKPNLVLPSAIRNGTTTFFSPPIIPSAQQPQHQPLSSHTHTNPALMQSLSSVSHGINGIAPSNNRPNSVSEQSFLFSSKSDAIPSPSLHLLNQNTHSMQDARLPTNSSMPSNMTSSMSRHFANPLMSGRPFPDIFSPNSNAANPNDFDHWQSINSSVAGREKRESIESFTSGGSARSSFSLDESWNSSNGSITESEKSLNRLSSTSVTSLFSDISGNRLSTSSIDSFYDPMNSLQVYYGTASSNRSSYDYSYFEPQPIQQHLDSAPHDNSLYPQNANSSSNANSPFSQGPQHCKFGDAQRNVFDSSDGSQFDISQDDLDALIDSVESDFSTFDITESGARIYDNTNVFVKHLPPHVDDELLKTYFQEFGEIVSCKVMMNVKNKTSLGFGFIRFKDPASAQRAIEKMTGFRMGKKKLLCKLSNKELPPVVGNEPRTNLYVKHLPPNYDNEKLRKLFEKFGTIKEVKVMVDKNTGQSKQIGFVRFEKQVAATRALFEMNNVVLKEEGCTTPLNVHYAETSTEKRLRQVHQQARLTISQQFMANKNKKSDSSEENSKNVNLFIFHLPPDIMDKELGELFSPFGSVESVRVIIDKNGVSKGFGFVKFQKAEDAARAIATMNGFKLGKKHIRVLYSNKM